MDIFEAIKKRKSVRDYSSKAVEKEKIVQIIDSGRLAATARNVQPWHFVVSSDKDTLRNIAKICPNGYFVEGASHVIAVFSDDTKYYIEDCSAATQNMLLAIEALGLGGCWIAGDKKPYADDIKQLFNVPHNHRLVSMISIGYHAEKGSPTSKKGLDGLIHWEKW